MKKLLTGAFAILAIAGTMIAYTPAAFAEEYYIDDPDAQVGDVYVDVETGEEYVVTE